MPSELPVLSDITAANPEINQLDIALERGATLIAWLSASNLRMARAVNSDGEIWGFGCHVDIDQALIHLGRDYRFGHVPNAYGHEGVYIPHLVGSPDASSELDLHLRRDGMFKVYKQMGKVACELSGYEATPVLTKEQEATLKRTGKPLYITNSPPDCKVIVYLENTVTRDWNYVLVEGPEGVNPWDFYYIQAGEGDSFIEAVKSALNAPKARKPKGYDSFQPHQA